MIRKVIGIYFSPVGGTAKMTKTLASGIAESLNKDCPVDISYESWNLLSLSNEELKLDDETVVVIGVPVYIGKVPLPAIELLKHIEPNGAVTIATVSYGGRTFGNALYELQHEAEEIGFNIIGAGAFSVKYNKMRNDQPCSGLDGTSLSKFEAAASSKIKRLAGCQVEGLRIKPAPVDVVGKLPIHGISRISPRAAAKAQELLEKFNIKHQESQWFL